jgi:hydroxymethylbilane synthase
MHDDSIVYLATRGSALALAQANLVLGQCRSAFPDLRFEIRVIRTTGDKLETASLAQSGKTLAKGLFTKELEIALLEGVADLAVHSLKDLPTELPAGLRLGAVGRRADVRDVLISCTGYPQQTFPLDHLRYGATVGTSSPRRRAQLLALRRDLRIVELRGNIVGRLQKLASQPELDAIVLAAAGLTRLKFEIGRNQRLSGANCPDGLSATMFDTEVMLPCVGQAAIGIETRENDGRIERICDRLNHPETAQCVAAERSFLASMGGGCASPVAAHAEIIGDDVRMRAISFPDGIIRQVAGRRERKRAVELGRELAHVLQGNGSAGGDGAPIYAHCESPERI